MRGNDRKMITVFLRGGLGNQMFQYALGLNLTKKHNTGLRLDTTFLNDRFPRRQFTYRTYDLDVFDLPFLSFPPFDSAQGKLQRESKFTLLSRISDKIPIPGLWLGIDLALIELKNLLGIQKIIKEKKESIFDPSGLRPPASDLLLYGFWQSPKYFEGVEDELRDAFKFRQPIAASARPFDGAPKGLAEAARLAEDITNSNSVSLHVRRGDYLLPNNQELFGGTDLDYYKKAIRHVADRVRNPKFFIFSDDIAWCRENIKPPFPTVYTDDASRGPKAAWHLELMSLCKHNIITNSSFSWWGAWLNRNPGKIVVAPAHWHPGQERDDAVLEEWARL